MLETFLSPVVTENGAGPTTPDLGNAESRREKLVSRETDLNNTETKAEFQRTPTGVAHDKPYSPVSRSVTQTNKFILVTSPRLKL